MLWHWTSFESQFPNQLGMHSLDAFPRFFFIFFHCSFHAPGPRHVKEVMWSLFYECGRRDMCNDGLLLLGLDMSRQDFGKCGWEPKHALAVQRLAKPKYSWHFRSHMDIVVLTLVQAIWLSSYTYSYTCWILLNSMLAYWHCLPHHLNMVEGKATLLPQPGSLRPWCHHLVRLILKFH